MGCHQQKTPENTRFLRFSGVFRKTCRTQTERDDNLPPSAVLTTCWAVLSWKHPTSQKATNQSSSNAENTSRLRTGHCQTSKTRLRRWQRGKAADNAIGSSQYSSPDPFPDHLRRLLRLLSTQPGKRGRTFVPNINFRSPVSMPGNGRSPGVIKRG
jgi:hypothetical protein